ncbi:MAG: uracil-DNA glycosylase [Deltaproteobacteria bacterium]|nr:uracil-DNA glycosylase [Deltaproteobacteria bacterium]MBI3389800.1 uracil-DNA glycosylase [Deltaproteobacteria bacterium]
MAREPQALVALHSEVVACRDCPRLVVHRERVAIEKRRQFRDCAYWGKPLPGFGDPNARVLLVGLAPAAHGGNRTGRMFTGDRSGDWLFAALQQAGFANQGLSVSRDDGLQLTDAYITAAVRCAPPDNKPTRDEIQRCREFLVREMRLLPRIEIVVALGRIGMDAYLAARLANGQTVPRPRPAFGHATVCDLGDVKLVTSYHPSQQNTLTGRLTRPMFARVFQIVRRLL